MILWPAALLLAAVSPAAASPAPVEVSTRAVMRAISEIEGFASPIQLRQAGTPAEIELGRRLFADKSLSRGGEMSCATCHQPERAFTDGLVRARGRGGRELPRNTPSLLNSTISSSYVHGHFFDGRAGSLEAAALAVIANPLEFDSDPAEAAARLGRDPDYARAFREAYGPGAPTDSRMARAIAAYVRSLVQSPPSPYDRVHEDPGALSGAQKRGLLLFTGKASCVSCHWNPDFTSGEFLNIGLKPVPGIEDEGRFAATGLASDRRAFKTFSLRNVARTAPYMHDGSLATLADVIEFYDRGGDVAEGRSIAIRPLHLTPAEKSDLEAFLHSLTSLSAQGATEPSGEGAPPPRAVGNGASNSPYWDAAGEALRVEERAESLVREYEAMGKPWTANPRYSGRDCRDGLKPEALLADLAERRFGAEETAFLEKFVFQDLIDYLGDRAFVENDFGLCRLMEYDTPPQSPYSEGVSPKQYKWAFYCRNSYVNRSLVGAMAAGGPSFAPVCRKIAALDDSARPGADALCAIIGENLEDLPRMCAKLPPRFSSVNWTRSCEYVFRTLMGGDADCEPFEFTSAYDRCAAYKAFARARRARDPKLCGDSSDCRVLMGEGRAVAALAAARVRAKVCQQGDGRRGSPAETRRAALALLDRLDGLLARAGKNKPPEATRQAERSARLRARISGV